MVSACGGGGGGGSSTNNNTPDPAPPPEPPAPTPQTPTYSLTGVITASASQAVDSDTNDPARVAVSNDSIAVAQSIGNPVTLGGYVNLPGAGAQGRSQETGDREDFYRVELLAGQTVTMIVADFEEADADLYLYNAQGQLVDVSLDIGQIERLVVQQDGTYFVNASIFAGGTNYLLAIGSPANPAELGSARGNIVPWQAVVKYHGDESGVTRDDTGRSATRRLGMTQRAGGRGRSRLMEVRQVQREAVERYRRLGPARHKQADIQDEALAARWETLLAIKSLRRDPAVSRAEPNYSVRALATPNDEAFPFQWHYPLIGLPDAWETTTGDSDIIVAVVDTGILAAHPDLTGQLVAGYDFVSDSENAADGDGIDSNPNDPGGDIVGISSFHGTHTAGTVAARGNNNIGVAGTAYGSRVMPLRALGSDGEGTTYDVEQAIRFAAGLENDSGGVPARKADIINLSLGGAPFQSSTQNLFDEVRAAGVTVVAAAGNEATSSPGYPASYDNVISVSAVDVQRRLTSYSNTGAFIDVAAPGGDNSVDINGDGYPDGVLSTGGSVNEGSLSYAYPFANGTSMAAPHVSGVIALMLSVNPSLTPADIDAMFTSGQLTDELGAPGRDDLFGHGLINAQKAVLAALEASGVSPADNPRLVASATSLNFSTSIDGLGLALTNGGKGQLELQDISTSEPWLQVNPVNVNGAGLGDYEVKVDRSNLPAGVYSARITVQSSVNNLSVTALMSVGGDGASADVGVVYVLLYDTEGDEPVAQFFSNGNNSRYEFDFANIPAGSYQLIAGSDADNDLLICDSGEACGAWRTTDQPQTFDLNADRDDFEFSVDFQVALPRVSANTLSNRGGGKGIARLPKDGDN